jgi:hypothetical protein
MTTEELLVLEHRCWKALEQQTLAHLELNRLGALYGITIKELLVMLGRDVSLDESDGWTPDQYQEHEDQLKQLRSMAPPDVRTAFARVTELGGLRCKLLVELINALSAAGLSVDQIANRTASTIDVVSRSLQMKKWQE